MAEPVEYEINNKKIKVIVTSSNQEVLDVLNKFKNNLSQRSLKVIGIESLAKFTYGDRRKAIIASCDGESCLVCPLTHFSQGARNYLANFLLLPHVIFVGTGIRSSLPMLEKDYGLCCRNVVELGPLTAPMVQYASSLARSAIDLSWGWRLPLSYNETGLIASTAYSYFDIACKKLGEIVPVTMDGTLYFNITAKMI